MKVTELLREDVARPLEMRDVIKFFPNTYKKVFSVKWGKPNALTWNGAPFFTMADGSPEEGPVYDRIEKAVNGLMGSDYEIEISSEMDLSPIDEDSRTHEFTFESQVTDKSLVYLGYSIDEDCLYAGFDMWVSEDAFNEAWDEEFKRATHEEFDFDDPRHAEIFNETWGKFKNEMFFGGLFRIDQNWNAEEHFAPQVGGFFKGIYRGISSFRAMDLIDL